MSSCQHWAGSPTKPDTIYALSTSPGKAGVAVVRISGPDATEVLSKMTMRNAYEPRRAYFRRIHHPLTGNLLDKGLVLFFPGPNSFTGEDIIELQIHGGNAVVKGVLGALGSIPSFRMAEPGEFAKRSFDNNKLDLTELEGLADLLNAETEMQRKLALRQAEGGLRVPFESWRNQIIHCMALTEAVIDFGEDENIEEGVLMDVNENIKQLRATIVHHLDDQHAGEIVRNGLHIAIMGPPNAGKSSFLNRLAKREAAIVSDIPGTTRDIVEVTMDLQGYPVIMSDTAGLRISDDQVEMEGVKRAQARAAVADIKICLLPLPSLKPTQDLNSLQMDAMVQQIIDDQTILLLNKQDLLLQDGQHPNVTLQPLFDHIQAMTGAKKVYAISCETGQGIDSFLKDLVQDLEAKLRPSLANPIIVTQARHRQHLENCVASMDAYLQLPEEEIVLGAEELRQAANALGRITGRIDVEDILDALFSQFCIGK
ncbi:tRNA modification GTPase TrmE [Hesseltinella vesiculosa]|uniref:tRNA modification GTPase TrmE n=1 Tax=Hesseltinella vesiculosa TaxID=101127 RepID=A0A1X2G5J3_9FUNG|nr:tRNA modification GTPase TrmE [Hesseltinella vesiculosa]